MKKLLIILFAFVLILFAGCMPKEDFTTEPVPHTAISAAYEPESKPVVKYPHEYVEYDPFEYAAMVLKENGDIDADGLEDRVVVWAAKIFQEQFNIELIFGNGKHLRQICDLDILGWGNTLYIADVTNDGKPDIVIPDLGGTDTRGTISCLLMELEGDTLIQRPVFEPEFFARESCTYYVTHPHFIEDFVDHQTVEICSNPTGKTFPIDCSELLEKTTWNNDVWNLDFYWDANTEDAKLVPLDDGTYGIKIATRIDLVFWGTSENEEDRGHEVWHIRSTIKYDRGKWRVIDEEILPAEFHRAEWYHSANQ